MLFLCPIDAKMSVNVGLKGCSCGKNTARGNKSSCLPSIRTVCPCVRKGMPCGRRCICKNCCNLNQEVSASGDYSAGKMPHKPLSCRCGEGMAKKKGNGTKYTACKDTDRDAPRSVPVWLARMCMVHVLVLPQGQRD